MADYGTSHFVKEWRYTQKQYKYKMVQGRADQRRGQEKRVLLGIFQLTHNAKTK